MLAQGIRLADRYAVRDRISYGGETVSRAYDVKTERFVLVRTVADVRDSELLLRVKALSTVEGTHLQTVLDAAVYDGTIYAICDDVEARFSCMASMGRRKSSDGPGEPRKRFRPCTAAGIRSLMDGWTWPIF